jgi:hypothetical protein
MPSITADALDELRARLDGGVCEPGNPEYDDTCTGVGGLTLGGGSDGSSASTG